LAASRETKEQIEKEKNIIIHGLNESTKTTDTDIKSDDKNELDKVLFAMKFDKQDKIKSFYRLKTNSKPSPLIVAFENISTINYARSLPNIFTKKMPTDFFFFVCLSVTCLNDKNV